MKHLTAFAFALVLAGCGTAVSPATVQTGQKSIITACATYATALSTAADFRSKMSAATQGTIDKIVLVVSPICDPSKPLPTDVSTSFDFVTASAAQITAMIGSK